MLNCSGMLEGKNSSAGTS